MIVFLDRDDTSEVLANRRHLHAHGAHPVGHLSHFPADGAQVLQHQIVRLDHYPTLPSRLTEISFCASTANSIGSCCSTSLTKPLTTSAVASSAVRPRCRQ